MISNLVKKADYKKIFFIHHLFLGTRNFSTATGGSRLTGSFYCKNNGLPQQSVFGDARSCRQKNKQKNNLRGKRARRK